MSSAESTGSGEALDVASGAPPVHADLRRHRALADPSRAKILQAVTDRGPLDVRDIASTVGLHVNTARTHLGALADAGLVKAERAAGPGPGRPRMLYSPTEAAQSDVRHYRLLAEILTGVMAQAGTKTTPRLEEAGERWGHHLVESPAPLTPADPDESLTRLLELLERKGFTPRAEPESGGLRILMTPCPFLELARRHREVVCPIHLGLIRGALTELGGALTATSLEPFSRPDLCVAHLKPARVRRPRGTAAPT